MPTAKQDQAAWAPRRHAGRRVPWAWVRLLVAHAELTRAMSANLLAEHGLTINDYEALLHLSWVPDGSLRRGELAERVHLTPGGVTRLLAGLESSGLVASVADPTDGRAVRARLTEAGRARLEVAARTHAGDVERMFSARFSVEELATLAELLGRLAGGDGRDGA